MPERDSSLTADLAQLQAAVDDLERRILLVAVLALAGSVLAYTLVYVKGVPA